MLIFDSFCKMLGRDQLDCYKSLSKGMVYNFFNWRLNQKSGKNGRVIRGTKNKSSLDTYWKVFRLVFERATGKKIDSSLNRGVHQVRG